MKERRIKITECPRDAMQGIHDFIPTEQKIDYLNSLLKVGFDRLDFGSFVSAKAIPQLRDTKEVLEGLDECEETALLAIIANTRGALEASAFNRIRLLGFPFSVSETFQLRNTNKTREQALETVAEIVEICSKSGQDALVYLSMGFGNPYSDEWSEEIVAEYANKLMEMGVQKIALADTIGSSTPDQIKSLYPYLSSQLPSIEWGLHLHSTPFDAAAKIDAALEVGCDRFDTAIRGFGGCPMAKDDLTGNIATETLLSALEGEHWTTSLNLDAFEAARIQSHQIFK